MQIYLITNAHTFFIQLIGYHEIIKLVYNMQSVIFN